MTHHSASNPEIEACIQANLDCFRACQQNALTHCLELGGKHVEPSHFRLMLDCAESCKFTATLMLNGSAYHPQACGLCAEICDACATSCRTVGGMDDCVAACERCAESCRQMAAMATPARSATTHASPRHAQ